MRALSAALLAYAPWGALAVVLGTAFASAVRAAATGFDGPRLAPLASSLRLHAPQPQAKSPTPDEAPISPR